MTANVFNLPVTPEGRACLREVLKSERMTFEMFCVLGDFDWDESAKEMIRMGLDSEFTESRGVGP